MRYLLVYVFLFAGLASFGQMRISTQKHDFGVLHEESNRVVDFNFTNTSEKVIYILRADVGKELDIKYTSKKIMPDSSAIMRLQVNPKKKGKFNFKFPLHVSYSYEPVIFEVSGQADFVPQGEYTPCPDFGKDERITKIDFELKVKVVDSVSGRPIEDAQVKILQRGLPLTKLKTNEYGVAKEIVTMGPYYFVITAPGFEPREYPVYLNKAGSKPVIRLQPQLLVETPDNPIPVEVPEVVVEEPTAPVVEEKPVEQPTIDPVVETKPDLPNELPRGLYKPNNVVFLIDISGSMKKEGRLDLLKASMIELLQSLRDIDRIAVVTYASGATVQMTSRAADQKEEIIALIQNLEAKGGTQGGKGVKLAFNVAKESFIRDGNNQVIVATDGAFGQEDGNIVRTVKTHANRGISLSVVGVVNAQWTVKHMQAMADNGKGRYIHIENYEQSRQLLLEEIKLNSRRQ